jgi:hypothetical protein
LSAFDPAWDRGFNGHPTAGSPLGHKISPETRAKLSTLRKGRKASPKRLAHLVKVAPLRNDGRTRWLARIHSDPDAAREHGAKLSAAFTGKTKTPEHRAKIALGHRGKIVSPETRAKQAKAQKERFARDLAAGVPRFGRSPQSRSTTD